VPAECAYTIDVRVTDEYTLEEVLDIIRSHVKATVTPRSLRMRPSGIDQNHPLIHAAKKIGLNLYGSPTTSDQALIPVPSVKIGPGDSARSHTADEFIYIADIIKGIDTYVRLLDEVIR
jgi:acetylornithine deacetylase